jgi:hypothetical protein
MMVIEKWNIIPTGTKYIEENPRYTQNGYK